MDLFCNLTGKLSNKSQRDLSFVTTVLRRKLRVHIHWEYNHHLYVLDSSIYRLTFMLIVIQQSTIMRLIVYFDPADVLWVVKFMTRATMGIDLYFKMKTLFMYVVCFNVIVESVGAERPTVSSPAGTFEGLRREVNVFGESRQVEKYLGIPYAEAPVGTRRFQRPELKAAIEQPYDATKYGASCMQLVFNWGGVRNPKTSETLNFSEDCLFLNIHKPVINGDKSHSTGLPVFVFIHGGGFVCGSSGSFNGDFLSAYTGVIVVTFNYRLAVWGFLSTGNNIAPGNLGLWDQHVALKWVNQNIATFGGDPNRVTISGMSAGGSSVVYQALFPKNKGLFQRAIAFAGSITCPWSYNLHPEDTTERFGKLVGCDTNSIESIVNCIKSKSTEELRLALNKPENGFRKFPMEFVTTIDGEFLKEHPLDMIRSNSKISSKSHEFFSTIEFMIGITASEGGLMVQPFAGVDNPEDYVASRDEFENDIVPGVTKLLYGEDTSELIYDMIIHEYTYWDNPNDRARVRDAFIDMSSNYVFDIHAKLVADLHSNISLEAATYVFVFDENPSMSFLGKPSWLKKVTHTDEQIFLFGYDREGILYWSAPYSEDYTPQDWELNVSKCFMTSMMNFVKSGNPNPSVDMKPLSNVRWPVYDASSGKYLNFTRNLNRESVQNHFCAKSYNFWVHLVPSVIEAKKQKAKGKSYFSPKDDEKCSSDEQCRP